MSNKALNIIEYIAATLLVVSATVLAILDEPKTYVITSHSHLCPCLHSCSRVYVVEHW